MKKKILAVLIALALLTGCWDRRELDTLLIVLGMGLDQSAEGIRMSLQASNIGAQDGPKGSAGEKGSGKAYITLSGEGVDMLGAARSITHETTRSLFLQHNAVIIFGSELARSGIGDYLDFLARNNEIRMDSYVLVSETTALDILNVDLALEKLPAQGLTQMISIQQRTAEGYPITLFDLVDRLLNKTAAPLAMMAGVSEDNGSETLVLRGLAVFSDDKMVGTLDQKETQGLLWVLNDASNRALSVATEGGTASLNIANSASKITAVLIDGKPCIKVHLTARGHVSEINGYHYLANEKVVDVLTAAGEDAIRSEITACVDKAQKLRQDVFDFGSEFHRNFKDEWPEISDNWNIKFSEMPVFIEIDLTLQDTGMIVSEEYTRKGMEK